MITISDIRLARQAIAIRAADHDHTAIGGKTFFETDVIDILLTKISMIVNIGTRLRHISNRFKEMLVNPNSSYKGG